MTGHPNLPDESYSRVSLRPTNFEKSLYSCDDKIKPVGNNNVFIPNASKI